MSQASYSSSSTRTDPGLSICGILFLAVGVPWNCSHRWH